MRLLIITADKSTLSWPSLDKKLAAIKIALNSGKNADWLVDIRYKSATPTINKEEEKIDTKWLQDHIKEFFGEYDMVAFHFSEKQSNAWGVRPTLRGSNPQTDDEFGDFYFSADADSKRLGFDRFVQVCLHEASHEYFVDTKQTDITHEYHSKHKDITGLYKTFDWSKFQARRQGLKKQKNALEAILSSLRAIVKAGLKEKPEFPVPFTFVTQPYGNPNSSLYKITGHHIGVDVRARKGTIVKAPKSGEVIESGHTASLGYYFEFVLEKGKHMVVPHLEGVVKLGKYRKGDNLGIISDTGLMTAPHFHGEGWRGKMNRGALTRDNWDDLTFNLLDYFKL
jgi:hypothetical protein